MAVVRCPRHDIPYNDRNPRGCPACAREREGETEEARAIQDLARASRGGVPGATIEVLPPEAEPSSDDVTAYPAWPPPVTTPPRLPTAEPGWRDRILDVLRENWLAIIGGVLGVVGLWLVWIAARPTFTELYVPPLIAGEPRPFPVEPNSPMVGVFALLGTVAPGVNRQAPVLARHDFGDGAVVDALNGVVYAVTLETPVRTWHGHRVGSGERAARGALALEGLAAERDPLPASPFPFAGFLTFRSLEALPRRLLTAEVRPPNGCYDVEVEIAPQVIGTATRGEANLVAVARRGTPLLWVVHRVRAVSRAMDGPWGKVAC